ncbi:hypothetical protein FJT64_009495 [Amphibalanus amphitrite]|uniref:Uncharacterized protein n=1 Tax=Amphibalanus amphitrite TaxID=1232801 RepID=A0A6A4VF41_AMPAM|nr:hypothetical protein FJT64_009495 [Amphibalanus amphitrite]
MRKAWAEHSLGLVRPTLLEFDQWLRLQLRIQLSCEAAAPAPSQQKRTAGMFLTTKTASTSDANDVPPLLVDPARFSSWSKYRRVLTWIYRFINNAREPDKKTCGSLTAQELLQSEHRIIRQDQKAVNLAPQPAIDERRWHPEDGRRHAAGGTAAFRGTTRRWGQQRSDDDTPLGVQRRSDDDTSLAVQRFQRVDARCRRREARRCWSRRTQRAGGD